MQRLEDEDILETFGWFIGMIAALGFLFGALVYTLHWMGLLQ